MHGAIRALYAVAVAFFLVLTVAFGTFTFYPSPVMPQYTPATSPPVSPNPGVAPDVEIAPAQQQYQRALDQYQQQRKTHQSHVLLIATLISAAVIIGGVAASAVLDILRVGLMLGGLFTLAWGLIYGASAAGAATLFIAALLILLALAALSRENVRGPLARSFRLGGGEDLMR